MKKSALFILMILLGYASGSFASSTSLVFNHSSPAIFIGAEKLKEVLTHQDYTVTSLNINKLSDADSPVRIIITTLEASENQQMLRKQGIPPIPVLSEEGYAIRIDEGSDYTAYWIIGASEQGAMYGALDVADKLRGTGSLSNVKPLHKNPYIKKRGIKFNIPLDARTPSYSDNNITAQENIPNMWDMEFWAEFLDEMALNRLNLLTLWSLSPFPSMVRIPEYPEIGLDDVKRTTLPVTQFGGSSNGSKNVTPEVLANLETIKKISLDEKITFWQEVMQYASNRGIDIYIYTWNVFVFGTEGSPYGLTDDIHNPATRDYIRNATKALLETYPLIKGIGITAGENLSHDDQADEQFLYETYGQAIHEVLSADPNRTLTLIHRLGDVSVAKNAFAGLHPRCNLSFCYKYSKAHVYSSVDPYWIHSHKFLEEIGDSTNFYITIRDDSFNYLRGGSDPGFVREYMRNIPNTRTNFEGFQLGPDATVWAREAVSRKPNSPPQLVLKKRWFSMRIWGKMAFDPDTPDEEFLQMLGFRFPNVDAQKLYKGWTKASQTIPLVNRFHNYKAYLDYQWNPELCDSRAGYNSETGFHDMATFIRIKTQREEGLIGIPEYVQGERKGTTPFQVAEQLLTLSKEATSALESINVTETTDQELLQTLADIRALAYLGSYYSHKISASTHWALFQENGEKNHREAVIADLQRASKCWWDYSHLVSQHYRPMYYSRLRKTIDVLEIQKYVDQELLDLGAEIPLKQ
jgi:hypothetical protein